MKNIQTGILKILALTCTILCSSLVHANDVNYLLKHADSLYTKKQYTQSFELYQSLYKDGRYSPAMLLKMAYIQEGLGQISLSLYYLNLYYLASGDSQVLNKLQELASKNKLEGYEHSEMNQVMFTLKKYSLYISGLLAAMVLFLLAIIYRQRKKETRPISAGILTTIMLVILALHVNFSFEPTSGIIAESNTYLMSGPSAGANVIALVGEGHKIKIKDKKDVWLKVEWLDKDAYIKENQVMKVQL